MDQVPESGGRLNLGVIADPDGLRGALDLSAAIGDHVEAIAQGSIRSSKDWSTMAGLRIKW